MSRSLQSSKQQLPAICFAIVVLSLLIATPASAAAKQTYIVYMGVHSHGLEVNDLDRVAKVQTRHRHFLSSFFDSKQKAEDAIIHSYTGDINGFAAVLDQEEAARIAKHPNVISVFLNKAKKLHTTRSWQFLSLEKLQGGPKRKPHPKSKHRLGLWKRSNYGDGVIIANLDTGVWPESKSFSSGRLGPVPSRWKGFCQNDTKTGVTCNRKLIGARYFNTFYKEALDKTTTKPFNPFKDSARDHEGHGTHTLSTAGGSFVRGANVFGLLNGTAKGGSPNARVAAYKVCWPNIKDEGGCYDGDILSAIDAAILDGVDVLSLSLGGQPDDYFKDATAIGSFHAVRRGIPVVLSAGNSGPDSETVTNLAPWIFTVAASTIDRTIVTTVKLGNGKQYEGEAVTKALPEDKLYPLISSGQAKDANASLGDAELCKIGTLDPKKVKGKIVTCLRGINARAEKGIEAARAGAVGFILLNDKTNGKDVVADPHVIPASHISYEDGVEVLEYIESTKNPLAYISSVKANLNTRAPTMASFSSRGPNVLTPGILKPDITAPGVDVIAAFTGDISPTESDLDTRRTSFTTMSGTSMSCPHVAGIVGLLKKVHPHWSPAAIKSAIMTTAKTRDNTGKPILDSFGEKATPFSFGAGHVRPDRAVDPGLVYDLGINDYLYFLCALGYKQSDLQFFAPQPYECTRNADLLNFNYPSITVTGLGDDSVTVRRTVKNVGSPGVYKSRVHHPRGVSVKVEPETLEFKEVGEEKSFELVVDRVSKEEDGSYQFGELEWSDEVHFVRSPIVIGS